MDVLKALEIERLKPIKNGIYICTNPEKKEFKLAELGGIPLNLNGKETTLKDIIEHLDKKLNLQNDFNKEVAKKYNDLIDYLKQYIIVNELNKIGGK